MMHMARQIVADTRSTGIQRSAVSESRRNSGGQHADQRVTPSVEQ